MPVGCVERSQARDREPRRRLLKRLSVLLRDRFGHKPSHFKLSRATVRRGQRKGESAVPVTNHGQDRPLGASPEATATDALRSQRHSCLAGRGTQARGQLKPMSTSDISCSRNPWTKFRQTRIGARCETAPLPRCRTFHRWPRTAPLGMKERALQRQRFGIVSGGRWSARRRQEPARSILGGLRSGPSRVCRQGRSDHRLPWTATPRVARRRTTHSRIHP
ncbi:hypothetical protein BDD21_4010 [Thiocapsa rosea]|uniref:Uncharacterized protein n=1 Tax=Thiocapsa rosea TaxID=69360 RepID=A0A495VDP8_9GAMM|nr:hypothetical protein BDD21_4010 [Thiocapsa rosea]